MAVGAAHTASAADPLALVGDTHAGQTPILTTVNPMTLAPTGAPFMTIPEPHSTPSLAFAAQRIAVGLSMPNPNPGQNTRVGLQLFDLRHRKVLQSVPTGIAAEAVEWYLSNRVAAFLQSGHLVLVNAKTGRIVERRFVGELGCTLQSGRGAQRRAVFLVGRSGRPARLAVARASSTIDVVTLPRVRFGATGNRCQTRAMAVDGGNAYVSAPGTRTITKVRLATMEMTHHVVRGLPGTRTRQLVWAEHDHLVIAGADAGGAAGAKVVDTRRWTARELDPRASAVGSAANRTVTFAGTGHGTAGLRAFGGAGLRPRWTARITDQVRDVQADFAWDRIYARTNTRVFVLDPRTGRTLASPLYPRSALLQFAWY